MNVEVPFFRRWDVDEWEAFMRDILVGIVTAWFVVHFMRRSSK